LRSYRVSFAYWFFSLVAYSQLPGAEHLLSYGRWIGSTALFRPELRLEHSYDLKAYDPGTKKTQFIAAGDVTYHL
jgi:hypothetical protein